MSQVKGKIPRSRARAAATRGRIIRAAYGLFCERGYRGTTMEDIGETANVAVQTVYFTFRTKDDLLNAVHEWTVLGDDPTPPALQDWHVAAMRRPDARTALPKLVAGTAALNARIAPMLPVFEAVREDPAGEVYRRSRELRRNDMRALVIALRAKTPLKQGTTQQQAADLLYFLMGPESYAALVLDVGWSEPRWVRWTSQTLCSQLFAET